jgi:hypothetical protein
MHIKRCSEYPERRERLQMSRYRQGGRRCESIWRTLHFYACYIRIRTLLNTLHILIIVLLQCAKPSFTPIHNLFNIQSVQVQNPIWLFLPLLQSPVVMICTVQWSLYVPPCLKLSNSTFCPHSVFICFVWIWEQTAIISLYSINCLVCITEPQCLLRGMDWIFTCNSDLLQSLHS